MPIGRAGANRKPCPLLQPSAHSMSRSSSVSMPSAVTLTPRASAKSDHRPHDMLVPFRLRDAAHKHLIDLDLVDETFLQRSKGRKAGAEIVERDGNTGIRQRIQTVIHPALVEGRLLRDLDFQHGNRQVASFHLGQDFVRNAASRHFARRQVHGDRQIAATAFGELVDHLAAIEEDILRKLPHHAHFAGDIDDFRRGDGAVLRMVPAQQRLESHHTPAGKFHHRLEIGLYLPGLDGDAQIALDALLALPLVMQALFKK